MAGWIYDSAQFWQREDDEGPRGWAAVESVKEYFAHLISSASLHYVIILSAASFGSWWSGAKTTAAPFSVCLQGKRLLVYKRQRDVCN